MDIHTIARRRITEFHDARRNRSQSRHHRSRQRNRRARTCRCNHFGTVRQRKRSGRCSLSKASLATKRQQQNKNEKGIDQGGVSFEGRKTAGKTKVREQGEPFVVENYRFSKNPDSLSSILHNTTSQCQYYNGHVATRFLNSGLKPGCLSISAKVRQVSERVTERALGVLDMPAVELLLCLSGRY